MCSSPVLIRRSIPASASREKHLDETEDETEDGATAAEEQGGSQRSAMVGQDTVVTSLTANHRGGILFFGLFQSRNAATPDLSRAAGLRGCSCCILRGCAAPFQSRSWWKGGRDAHLPFPDAFTHTSTVAL